MLLSLLFLFRLALLPVILLMRDEAFKLVILLPKEYYDTTYDDSLL